jgi:hydrophobic/amphiphilic exporter-1 (mainly G- bacteria), HAE1 family
MRIAIPPAETCGRTSAPWGGSSPTAPEPAPALQARHRAPEELWAPYGKRASLLIWVLGHRLLTLGLVLVLILGAAAILPAPGIADRASASPLARPGFPALGAAVAPTRLAAVQLAPRNTRRVEPSRSPLSLITPSALPPSAPPATAHSVLVGMDLPAGVTATMPGQAQEGQHSFRSLLLAFALAVFLVYLVTASQLESLLNPLSILFTVPMGLIAAAWGLYATGAMLNAVVLIGTILLAGILVNNAIILIDAIKNARATGTRARDAMIQASRARVRPIMITSIGTVLGLLPMAIGVGESIGIRRPMTITVIAGIVVATFLVAVAAPVLYTLFDPRADKTTI